MILIAPRRKVNTKDIEVDSWGSPKGTFQGSGRSISIALGRKPASTDVLECHPFDVEILRIHPAKSPISIISTAHSESSIT